METSLHRALKRLYSGDSAGREVPLGRYRIDAKVGERLFEIQHGSLAAIRDKVRQLLESYEVTVVKPVVVRKRIVKRITPGGAVLHRRMSPKRGRAVDVFEELVHFTRVFPHPRLTLEIPLVEVEEWRYPGHGRRRRRREGDFVIEDQRLVQVRQTHRIRTSGDLRLLVDCELPMPFHTGHLAVRLGIPRWIAQRVAYTLRQAGAVRSVDKRGNAILYEWVNEGGIFTPPPPRFAGRRISCDRCPPLYGTPRD